jgi:predicted GIY-YIG superfamily endonuclease
MTTIRSDESFTQWGLTYVYVIESSSGHFKIGISDNPARRMRQLTRTKGPFDYSLIFFCGFDDRKTAREIEAHLHEEFRHARARGEWFSLSAYDLIQLGTYLWEYITSGIAGPKKRNSTAVKALHNGN